ncbi:DNA-binding response regulator, OmpR family, contains REC and winged-helix (wHTH) domain [Propionispira arboris]|uniref:DNA-binding response regulator, OmpR family, contains REC and winged-helix (WHTH) domain n=1 Tax=Propionispira arboris TaxID=84035 RepID=A0A1H6WWR6_9FIRM|nr:response regulator transcription factor [Propionispira arboris]SEJ21313.1 DNA-binding response regulator, OmpR family, contains REC and winged-helix (wHTH) domain [Propionispira arboris]
MRVLLAEDDLVLGKLIQYMLRKQGILTDWVQRGDAAYQQALENEYDIVILDWMMPVETGISVCRRLRMVGYQPAILLLTARDAVEDRVTGLDVGADDYLVKPFEKMELLARLRALMRRTQNKLQQDIIQLGQFTLNRTLEMLLEDAVEINLSPREFQLLDLLVQNKGSVVPREVIFDRVWGRESEVGLNCIDFYIKSLRKKMNLSKEKPLIHTVRGVGYKLEE